MTAMAHSADACRAGTRRLGHDGLVPRTRVDRSSAVLSGARAVRSWPLLVLAAPAAAEVWSGWVGIAQKTGFGLVSPLPGIWPSLHLDTTITLPSGSRRTPPTRCAPGWPARTGSAPGPAGSPSRQRSAHSRSAWPDRWPITCWPRPGRRGHRGPSPRSCPACRSWSWPWGPRWPTCCAPTLTPQQTDRTTTGPQDQPRPGPPPGPPRTRRDRPRTTAQAGRRPGPVPRARTRTVPKAVVHGTAEGTRKPALAEINQARLIASRLTAAGKPVSRRALRSEGIKGSNQALNALARRINAELADAARPAGLEDAAPRS